jgi:uncharacterized protein (TIGR02300 family)
MIFRSAVMAESNWGRKHLCLECHTRFYDMRRRPIACPKCGTAHQPAALLKSDGRPPRRNRLQPTLVPTPAVEPDEAVALLDPETPELDTETDEDDVDDAEDAKEGAETIADEQSR